MRSRWIPLVSMLLLLSGCTRSAPPPPAGTAGVVGNLTIEEYPVVSATVDAPRRFEFRDRIPPAVLTKRQGWREAERYGDVELLNRALAPFGYSLAPSGEAVDLYKGASLIKAGLHDIGRISTTDQDFAFVARVPGEGPVLVRSGGITPWDDHRHGFIPPVLTGAGLIAVEAHYPEGGLLPTKQIPHSVTLDGVEIYRFMVKPQPTRSGVERLSAWGDRWVVELLGDVLVDGKSLNQEHGYKESFGWRLLGGKPFYFVRTGRSFGMVYDGEFLPQRYTEIPHYQCCEPAMFNPGGNSRMVWFYGLRDGVWHYVEIGEYGEE